MRVPFAIACMGAILAGSPLVSQEDCCAASLNVGFSTELLRGVPPFEGIEGLGQECDAAGAVVDHVISTGPQRVYLNVASNFPLEFEGGVQGWSLTLKLTGGGDFVSVTTAGTAADRKESGGLWSGGFNKTGVLSPFCAGGGKGVTTGVILSLTEGTTLPLQGTETILDLEVSGTDGGTSDLMIAGGLYCGAQPVTSAMIVSGDSLTACNQGTAAIRIRHIDMDDFIRGNANGDARLDIADPVWILNALFHDGPPSPCTDAADSNDDGRVDISDAVHVIRYLFLTDDAPPQPFPGCGLDPTGDEIGCVGESAAC